MKNANASLIFREICIIPLSVGWMTPRLSRLGAANAHVGGDTVLIGVEALFLWVKVTCDRRP